MMQKNGADKPDDYKRFSSADKEYDSQQSLDSNAKTENAETDSKDNINDSTDMAGKYFDPSDYEGATQLEKGLAETHEQVSDDYFEGTIDQNLD
ncbi:MULTISPECIES: YozQ family protein [Bacillus]|uniref:YozQ family protein n=1 Tax=Bacillus TaxID=1386 RepID=UPI00080E7699|nr:MULTISPECIES: YozQ family protein [Bacillus]MDE1383484.1 YozQ family protein [Bacillus paralicheniformis]TAI53439.1 DUF4025 domain-containing protein [Bacillus paralicheniformis]